jgi:hypothetical protein
MLTPVIDEVAKNLEQINDSNEITSRFKFKVSLHPSMSQFKNFYIDFSQVLRKNLPLNTPTMISQTVTPPLQTTIPPNPQYSSSSADSTDSTNSTSSKESKPEHHAQAAANGFLYSTVITIEEALEKLAWYHGDEVQLQPTFLLLMIYLIIGLNRR